MVKEKSCGAVVFHKDENNQVKVLLIKHNLGHWAFPKGHVENEETEMQTALREIKEETNLDVCLDTDFRHVITYFPKENVSKDVVYFIAWARDISQLAPQPEEIEKIIWSDLDNALDTVTYENEKNILSLAISYIK